MIMLLVLCIAGHVLAQDSKVSVVHYWPSNNSYTWCFECGYDDQAAAWGAIQITASIALIVGKERIGTKSTKLAGPL
jgi:hypothetical protein